MINPVFFLHSCSTFLFLRHFVNSLLLIRLYRHPLVLCVYECMLGSAVHFKHLVNILTLMRIRSVYNEHFSEICYKDENVEWTLEEGQKWKYTLCSRVLCDRLQWLINPKYYSFSKKTIIDFFNENRINIKF